jgi:membrane protease YdiL (CAAX protease family)
MDSQSNRPEPVPAPIQADSQSPGPPASRLRSIFVGPNGLRAGWRFAIYVALFVVCLLVVLFLLVHIPAFGKLRKQANAGTLTPPFLVVLESAQFGAALFAAWVMCRIEKGNFGSYGIPLRGAFGKSFWNGIVWGLAFMSIEMCAMNVLGGFSFGGLAIQGLTIAKYAVIWAVGFVLVGFFEEFLFRGYAQYTLTTGIGFWPAALLLSAAFGGVHLTNVGENWVGALSVFTFALFACFTLRRTGNLWFAIGFHAAADYAESFLYSVPDSGTLATGHLLNSRVHGPRWLTGGSVGPEGSVLNFAVFVLAFAIFAWLYPAKKAELSD